MKFKGFKWGNVYYFKTQFNYVLKIILIFNPDTQAYILLGVHEEERTQFIAEIEVEKYLMCGRVPVDESLTGICIYENIKIKKRPRIEI